MLICKTEMVMYWVSMYLALFLAPDPCLFVEFSQLTMKQASLISAEKLKHRTEAKWPPPTEPTHGGPRIQSHAARL